MRNHKKDLSITFGKIEGKVKFKKIEKDKLQNIYCNIL